MDFGTVPSVIYEGKTYLYLPYLYEAETESAYRVHHLMEAGPLGSANLAIERFEKENGFRLAKEQRDAVEKSMKAGMLVITGVQERRHSFVQSSRRQSKMDWSLL